MATIEDTHSISRYLLINPTAFQKALHWGPNQISYYGHEMKAIAFSVRMWDKLPSSPNNEYTSFKVNPKYNILRGIYLEFTTPAMKVKPEYKDKIKIGLPRKMAHFVFEHIVMLFNGDPGPSLCSDSLNIHEQYFVKGFSHQQNYLREIGDIPSLTTMSNHIPSYRYQLWVPFFFSFEPALNLPMHRCTYATITFDVRYKNDIENILRYEEQVEVDGRTRTNVTVDIDKIEGLGNPNSRIISPIMRGLYVKITKEEQEEIAKSSPDYMDIPCYIPVDIVNNSISLGEETPVPLEINYPAKAIFWMAEISKNPDRRIFANYTTNQFDERNGSNPCDTATLMYNKQAAMRSFPQEHFERIESRFLPAAPRDIGYNVLNFCENNTVVDVEPGIDLAKNMAQLKITLFETDRYKIQDHTTQLFIDDDDYNEENELNEKRVKIPHLSNKKYYLHVIALVTRRLKFVTTKDGVTIQCPQAADIKKSNI